MLQNTLINNGCDGLCELASHYLPGRASSDVDVMSAPPDQQTAPQKTPAARVIWIRFLIEIDTSIEVTEK